MYIYHSQHIIKIRKKYNIDHRQHIIQIRNQYRKYRSQTTYYIDQKHMIQITENISYGLGKKENIDQETVHTENIDHR